MISNNKEIVRFLHCARCLTERESDESYSQDIEVGFTKDGIQVWCRRHNANICHIDFQGKGPFPANISANNVIYDH